MVLLVCFSCGTSVEWVPQLLLESLRRTPLVLVVVVCLVLAVGLCRRSSSRVAGLGSQVPVIPPLAVALVRLVEGRVHGVR